MERFKINVTVAVSIFIMFIIHRLYDHINCVLKIKASVAK